MGKKPILAILGKKPTFLHIVGLHIFPKFLFLVEVLSFLQRKDNIFARNENIRKICKQTIT